MNTKKIPSGSLSDRGKMDDLILSINPIETKVSSLKSKIKSKLGIPESKQQLVTAKGYTWIAMLADYNVCDGISPTLRDWQQS